MGMNVFYKMPELSSSDAVRDINSMILIDCPGKYAKRHGRCASMRNCIRPWAACASPGLSRSQTLIPPEYLLVQGLLTQRVSLRPSSRHVTIPEASRLDSASHGYMAFHARGERCRGTAKHRLAGVLSGAVLCADLVQFARVMATG
jgi:hypothetical protein